MTPTQVAINHAAITEAADALTRAGYDGDAHAFCEHLVLTAVAAGWRRIEKPPPPRAVNVATEAQRRAALDTIRTTLRNRETA